AVLLLTSSSPLTFHRLLTAELAMLDATKIGRQTALTSSVGIADEVLRIPTGVAAYFDPLDGTHYYATLVDGQRREVVQVTGAVGTELYVHDLDRKSTRLNSSHVSISYAVFCLKKKKILDTCIDTEFSRHLSVHDQT